MRFRVLHLVISLAPGGLERLVVDWTNARNVCGAGPTDVCCLDEPGLMAGQIAGGSVHVLNARRGRFPVDLPAVFRLRRLLRREGFHVIHSHNAAAHLYAGLAAAGIGIRHVHTEHGSRPPAGTPWARLRDRLALRLTDDLVAVSEAAADGIRALSHERRIDVIPNGVRPHVPSSLAARERLREKLGIPPPARVIGSVGRLAVVKGHDRLITAFAALVRDMADTDLRLLLVGDGSECEALARQAMEAGVADRVVFAGFRRDPARFYDIVHLFVLPSRSEGLSVALLEAMAAGIPVAATDAGANRDVLEDGKCGVLLPDDEGGWPVILRGMLAAAGEADAGRRVNAALARVTSAYAMDATLERYEGLYERVRGGGRERVSR
jgi:glycosyltransferase involved in cell wall biosynthesis